MIFQPVLHPVILAVIGAAALAAVIWSFLRSPDAGSRVLWGGRALLVIFMITALLRPGIPGGTTTTLATDTDIVLMVDTTASIAAEDWGDDEQRLDGVRADVRAIIAAYPGARYALITFDADPQLRLPLTTDTSAVVSAMDVLRPEVTAQSRGSSIGIAANLLTDTLRSAAESSDGRSRMVFSFGDGEQTVASDPESFSGAAEYVDSGMVFGYGTAEGGRMKITSGRGDSTDGYIQYQGSDARSVIDEDNLRRVADQLGVDYQHRTADTEPDLPPSPTTSKNYTSAGTTGTVTELFWIPVLGVIALLATEVARAAWAVTGMRSLTLRPRRGKADA